MRIIGGRFAVDRSWGPYRRDMSEVVRAVDMKNAATRVAVKIFPQDAFQQNVVMEAFSRECESLKRLSSHENIVTLVDIGRDQDSGASYRGSSVRLNSPARLPTEMSGGFMPLQEAVV